MFLQIVVNNAHIVDTDEQTAIPIKWTHPLFNDTALMGAASYNFTLPATNQNKSVFNGYTQTNTVKIIVGAALLYDGYLTIKSHNSNKRFTCTYTENYLKDLSDTYIDEIIYPQQAFVNPDVVNAQAWPTANHCYPPMYMPNLYNWKQMDGYNEDEHAPLQYYIHQNTQYANLLYTGYNAQPNSTFIPCFYLAHVLKLIFAAKGYTLSGDFFSDQELCKLVVPNNFDIVNYTVTANTATGSWPTDISLQNHLPHITVKSLLTDLRTKVGLLFFVNSRTKNAYCVLAKNIIKGSGQLQSYSAIVEKEYEVEFDDYNLPNLCFSTDEFDSFCNKINVGTTGFNIVTVAATYLLPQANTIGNADLYFVQSINQYVQSREIESPPGSNIFVRKWVNWSHNYYCTQTTNSSADSKTSTAPLLFDAEAMLNSFIAFVFVAPRIDWVASTNSLVIGKQTGAGFVASGTVPAKNYFGFRLCFYRGLQNIANTALQQPYATTTNYDWLGNSIGSLSLQYNGVNGLFENYIKPYYDALKQAKTVTWQARANLLLLNEISSPNAVTITNNTSTLPHIIKEASITITNNRCLPMQLTTVEF